MASEGQTEAQAMQPLQRLLLIPDKTPFSKLIQFSFGQDETQCEQIFSPIQRPG